MTKPMKLIVLVEEASFGRVFRSLDSMAGIAGVQIVSEAHPPAAAKSAAKNTVANGSTTQCVILRALKEGPHTWGALLEITKKAGKARASAIIMLRSLLKAKRVKVQRGAPKVTDRVMVITNTGAGWLLKNCKGAH